MFQPAVTPPSSPAPRQLLFLVGTEGLLVREADGRAEVPGLSELPAGEVPLYLGHLDDADCWAAHAQTASSGLVFRSLRALYGALPDEQFAAAGRAVQLVEWDQTSRFCGRCGAPTVLASGERARRCAACALNFWPRIAPAVIVLVRRGSEVLLARNARYRGVMFSTLAGFVEAGESLEETIHREIREEVGVEVKDLRYFGSQPWPFPHSLMIGFNAEYAGGELRVDGDEIVEAAWFKADALPPVPPKLSIARQLIDAWAEEQRR